MTTPPHRRADVSRVTRETDIAVTLDIDGSGRAEIATGLAFFDHMLELLTRHALFDLRLRCTGDLAVDAHHTVEDVGLVLGEALDRALGERMGITRYGAAHLPMDDACSVVALDLGGRPYLLYLMANRERHCGNFDLALLQEFFRGFVTKGRLNLHIDQRYGKDGHHAHESVFKAVARALRQACAIDPREHGAPSSKGTI